MALTISTIVRAIGLGLAGTLLLAAGQFPVALTSAAQIIAIPVDPDPAGASAIIDPTVVADDDVSIPRPARLSALVAETIDAGPTAYGERECLARAVYFEARGEPLEGQLAVAQVILNRVASGHFADSVCGVIAQHGQFSFDKARTPPVSRDWATAKAIAAIAATAGWEPMAPRAVAFHAVRINASWSNLHKVGTIGNHVFYR